MPLRVELAAPLVVAVALGQAVKHVLTPRAFIRQPSKLFDVPLHRVIASIRENVAHLLVPPL